MNCILFKTLGNDNLIIYQINEDLFLLRFEYEFVKDTLTVYRATFFKHQIETILTEVLEQIK